MNQTITITIPTTPKPKGSLNRYKNHLTDRNAAAHKLLKGHVRLAFEQHPLYTPSLADYTGPVTVRIVASKKLSTETQKRYLRTHKILPQPTTKHSSSLGDVDKLARAVLDTLSGLAYKDDSQVTCLYIEKRLTEKPDSTIITITHTQQP